MENWAERKPSIVFECEDTKATYELLKKRGVEFDGKPKKMAWGAYVSFQDTDGNEFLLKSD